MGSWNMELYYILVGPCRSIVTQCKISLLKCGQVITQTHQCFLAAAQRSLGCHFAPHLHYDVAQLLLIWRLYMDSLPDMPTSLALCKSNLNIVSVAASYSIYSYWKIKWHKAHSNEMFVCLCEWMPSILSFFENLHISECFCFSTLLNR